MKEKLKERILNAIVLAIENFVIKNDTHNSPGNEVYMLAEAYVMVAKTDTEEDDDEK